MLLHGKIFKLNPFLSLKSTQKMIKMINELNGIFGDEFHYFITENESYPSEMTVAKSKMVTPLWIESIFKNKKYYSPEFYSPDIYKIFSGYIVHCHGIDTSDTEMIYGGIQVYGGQWREEYDNDITHLIVKDDASSLCKQSSAMGIKVIAPEYFDDCFKIERKCDDSMYLFPNPMIYRDEIELYKEKPFIADGSPMFLKDIIIYIDPLLIQSVDDSVAHLPRWIHNTISFGAEITKDINKSSIAITDIQNDTYRKALDLNKLVGTKRWMRDQIKYEMMLNNSHLLYYPRPNTPINEFKNMIISITNYNGRSREDIVLMAQYMGAKVTRTMTMNNTHLICSL
jgi:hypothetical protein